MRQKSLNLSKRNCPESLFGKCPQGKRKAEMLFRTDGWLNVYFF